MIAAPPNLGTGGGGSSVTWSTLSGKPSEFPPSAHTHEIADVTDLATEIAELAAAIDTKAPIVTALYSNGASQTIDWANGTWQSIAATGNLAIAFTGTPPVGALLEIRISAGAADRVVTFPAGVLYDYDVAAVTIPAGYTKVFRGRYDGSAYEFGYSVDKGTL
jgi:hypothetical protein